MAPGPSPHLTRHSEKLSGNTSPTYCGQTREICEKQEKYVTGKVLTFIVQSLILYQYPVDLLTFLELYYKSSKHLKMGKFRLVDDICQSNFVRVQSILKEREKFM